jgi:HD-like signal output (HDOD) protein
MSVWLSLAILIAAVGALLYLYRRRWRVQQRVDASTTLLAPSSIATVDAELSKPIELIEEIIEVAAIIPFQTAATLSLSASIYSLSFSVPHFDYQILGPHREVLDAAKAAVDEAVNQASYFPRKPALLPKLLRALNASDTSREEIVRLILQDPVLAGNVLKRANSAFYRNRNPAIESMDRAVVLLGNDGLRAPVATSIMQPVFQLPRGFFDHFAPITWELAQRTAIAAESYARLNRTGDTFVAHLLGLLGGLGRIVLFRMTLDKYRSHNILPRAEVFIRVMMDHEHALTRQVAKAWELSPAFLAAIDAQREQTLPQHMTPLARTLYYANLCGALAVLSCRDKLTPDQAQAQLTEQGLSTGSIESMWAAAAAADFQ